MDETFEFLSQISPEDIDWLIASSEPRTLLAEQILIAAGSRPRALFFVLQGSFEVALPGLPRPVNRLGRGSVIGEVAWLERSTATATVKAISSGEVLALPVEVLDAELARSAERASRFHSAIARLLAMRLRKTTLHLTASAAQSTGSIHQEGLERLLSDFKQAVVDADRRLRESPGAIAEAEALLVPPFERVWRSFDATMRALPDDASRELLGVTAQRELLPYVLLSPLAERSYSKPRGYAGDFLTIEEMYRHEPHGAGRLGPLIDRIMHSLPPVHAARNRRGLLAGLISETLDRVKDRPVHITSLACGPAREIFDVFEGPRGDEARERLFVTALDIDHEALTLLSERLEEANLVANVTALRANLIHVCTGRHAVEQPPQDLVYSIGLIDYFADPFVIALMDWIHGQLRDGGRTVLGNFAPGNPAKAFMDHVLDWKLIHRAPGDMDRLFSGSRFGQPTTRVLFEAQGINLFAECPR
jgi:extracellular factor (EF) 3-hydroxypalmitic acid methyl ester biosynthesis protein